MLLQAFELIRRVPDADVGASGDGPLLTSTVAETRIESRVACRKCCPRRSSAFFEARPSAASSRTGPGAAEAATIGDVNPRQRS